MKKDLALAVIVLIIIVGSITVALIGCEMPAGSKVQTGGIGVFLEPLGAAPAAPRVRLGSFSTIYHSPTPPDSGGSINRFGAVGPGFDMVGTVVDTNGVGTEFKEAGPSFPGIIKALHPPTPPLPATLPANTPASLTP